MCSFKLNSSDLLDSIKETGYQEINLFKVDFEIIVRKIYVLFHLFLETLPNIVIALIIFGLCMLASRVVRSVIRHRVKVNISVGLVFERLSHIALIVTGILVALAIIFPSIKPVDLLSGFGIASLAIGFAVKDLLNNFLSGILILLQQPFKVGDEIKHKKLEGIVEDIHIRYTIIKGFDGCKFLIPNGEIYSDTIVVNTLSKCRSTSFEINIDISNDIEIASHILLSVIEKVEGVLTDPAPKVSVVNMSSNAITLKCSWYTTPYHDQVSKIKSLVLKQIKKVLHSEHITSPLAMELFSQRLSVIPNISENEDYIATHK